jgi:Amt family ammonium transporter
MTAGAWGTIAVAFSNPDATLAVQAIGVIAVGAFVGVASCLFWLGTDASMSARLGSEQERSGGDIAEFGLRAHIFG